jgi:hypothetical protein
MPTPAAATHAAMPARGSVINAPSGAALLFSVPGALSMRSQTNRSTGDPAASGPLLTVRQHSGDAALAATSAAWAAGLGLILGHRIFVTNDSLSNYIHVWYVADRLWHGHGVPLHMPVIGHGDALAFPYGFLPWFSAALLRPLLGDWVVTLWIVIGLLGVVAAMWRAFPEVRGSWWFAILLIEPMLVEAPLLGQLPFLWATAFLFAAIAMWREQRAILAIVFLSAAQVTHPAVILPIAGVAVLARLWWEPRRLQLFAAYAVSLAIAAPAAWMTLASPTVEDLSRGELIGNFFGTVILRAIVIASPFIALVVQRTPLARVPAAIFIGLVALNVALVPVRRNEYAWGALVRTPDTRLERFITSQDFARGASYRILRVGDGKVGMYQLLRAGARLDSEPFPESIDRRSFPSTEDYVAFLRKRHVRYVIVYDAYDSRYGTNEHEMLRRLATGANACALTVVDESEYDVYAIGC